MNIPLDKARKLITELEAKLKAAGAHATEACRVLDEWLGSGEVRLRKKGAAALRQVRKRADGFAKSLSKLEKKLGESLEKMPDPPGKVKRREGKAAGKGKAAKGEKPAPVPAVPATAVAKVPTSKKAPARKRVRPPRKRAAAGKPTA